MSDAEQQPKLYFYSCKNRGCWFSEESDDEDRLFDDCPQCGCKLRVIQQNVQCYACKRITDCTVHATGRGPFTRVYDVCLVCVQKAKPVSQTTGSRGRT